jgi:dienelactone hydrolase
VAASSVAAMTTVLIAHSALGLRPAVLDLAQRVRALGFRVVAPDLFGGAVFEGGPEGYAAAMAHLDTARASAVATLHEAYAACSAPVVVIGFSMGAMAVQRLAEHEPAVLGALLVAGGGRYGAEFGDDGRWGGRHTAGFASDDRRRVGRRGASRTPSRGGSARWVGRLRLRLSG